MSETALANDEVAAFWDHVAELENEASPARVTVEPADDGGLIAFVASRHGVTVVKALRGCDLAEVFVAECNTLALRRSVDDVSTARFNAVCQPQKGSDA